METVASIAIMKALADESRLAIMRSLLEHPQYVEEIAKRHALAPSTVSFHLRKLEQAGLVSSTKEQYYVVVRANEPIFATTLRELVVASPAREAQQNERMDEYRRKVLETFFRHGILEKLPSQHKKRLIVLEQFALRFQPGQRYTEPEVTGLIRPLFDDYCTVRRLLVDEGLIHREESMYWRDLETGASVEQSDISRGQISAKLRNDRAELKRLYKQNRPEMGVYQIRNRANGKIYVECSKNLEGSRTSRLFELRMGKIVFNRELQSDLSQYGADSFEFTVLEVLATPDQGANIDHLLMALKLRWQETLQPFDERGYNSQKGFQREQEQLSSQGG